MRKRRDLQGQQFDGLTVIGIAPPRRTSGGRAMVVWACRCKCGKETLVDAQNLLSGNTQSCGCGVIVAIVQNPGRNLQHGYYGTPTYSTWNRMRERCNNPNNVNWPRYGGRGITVDPRWDSFQNFIDDMGEKPPGMQIDRIDNDGPYAPGNCRWATATEQANNRSTNRLITFDGRTQTLSKWAFEVGLTPTCVALRLRAGWTVEDSLQTPNQGNGKGNVVAVRDMRGTKHPGVKLTEDEVREIRASDAKQAVLAAKYGVTQSMISNIRRRTAWSHLA
jgi:hypothetical protein